MLKKLLHISVCLLLLIIPTSCDNWLDLQPQDGITKDKFWKTKEQVQAGMSGIYASMLAPSSNSITAVSSLGGNSLIISLFLWGELRADMLTTTFATRAEDLDIMNVNVLASNGITNWRTVYQIINYCNTVIDFAPAVLENDKTFTQESLNSYVAEAKTIRALMYFYLARTFGDVPLKLKATSTDEEIQQIPKNTQAEVLDQIVKDLNEAEPNAPLTYGNTASDKGRITRYTVNALQADVYLWMEKYAEVLTACDKITKSGKFGLIEGSRFFNAVFVQGNSNESIFELQFDRQRLNEFYPLFANPRRFSANAYVMDYVYTQDFTDDTKKDLRGPEASVRATDGMIWKYSGINATQVRAIEDYTAHWMVYRYADILLMKAEALALLNRGAEALGVVKTIRNRANALELTNENPDPSDSEAVADFILSERAREFAFEGKRWYDVLRHSKRNKYKRMDIMLEMVARAAPPDRQQSAIAKYKDFNSHYLPIYQYELQTDKNLIQNPFYK
ncbi:putative outer membrane starch-binding protein [Arcicella aurantiaca]|uniref:Putative outer membrane starch-binding protein n=1 Tax=Arcicella aurantiaca TaxID=591202 RepID=A0A316DLL1_9BACT|nr:RagB/SusD family nutrient uptake outer membrane protein [Arcicella aurantiaca]PWK18119.1 putative outer membrane starch-binding protein [Arcicella aurantiaca]